MSRFYALMQGHEDSLRNPLHPSCPLRSIGSPGSGGIAAATRLRCEAGVKWRRHGKWKHPTGFVEEAWGDRRLDDRQGQGELEDLLMAHTLLSLNFVLKLRFRIWATRFLSDQRPRGFTSTDQVSAKPNSNSIVDVNV